MPNADFSSTYPQVLSVATALSIQAHPDKVLAAKLFAERPDIYKVRSHAVCSRQRRIIPALTCARVSHGRMGTISLRWRLR